MAKLMSRGMRWLVLAAGILAAAGCGGDPAPDGPDPRPAAGAHTLFVAYAEGTLNSYDIATGQERPGSLTNVKGATEMQALADGTVIVNLTTSNEIVVFDGATMQAKSRVASSATGGTTPVHSYVTPAVAGKTYWVTNNDGTVPMLATNTLRFLDLTPGSSTYLRPVGEVTLPGMGHHKNAFSVERARVSVSNIADCNSAVAVIDYSNVANPTVVKSFSASEMDPSLGAGCASKGAVPHGGAFARAGKRGYHNLTGWGKILSVAQDEDPPTLKLLDTNGSGSGYAKAGKDGRYVYSLQNRPREGDVARPGVDCQIGQLVVIDGMQDSVVKQLPLLYMDASCREKLVGTEAATVAPEQMKISADGKTIYVASQGTPPAGSLDQRYSNQLQVIDVSDPANPVQRPSIAIGRHSGHRAMAITGDGRYLYVANGSDSTVSELEISTNKVKTLTTKGKPTSLATWGSAEGPSDQTGPH